MQTTPLDKLFCDLFLPGIIYKQGFQVDASKKIQQIILNTYLKKHSTLVDKRIPKNNFLSHCHQNQNN